LTRPVIDAETAKTIAVEMMVKSKCTTCTEIGLSERNRNSDTDNNTCMIQEDNTLDDMKTPSLNHSANLSLIAINNKTRGKTEKRNIGITKTETVPSSSEKESEISTTGESTSSSNMSSADKSVLSASYYNIMPTVVSKRETPYRKRDKIIPVKFMHLLWFAGLRGAVAYACAREFPDVYGNRNEFIAATMVIVVITIVLMGGATEPLMDRLSIRMNVDNDEYMREWHQKRKLKGRFLHFEYHWIYRFVVQDEAIRLMDESCGYIEQVDNETVFGFVSAKDLAANISITRRKEKERKFNGMGNHSRFRSYQGRQPPKDDEFGLDSTMLADDFAKNRSLLDEQDEEDPSDTGLGNYIGPSDEKTDCNHSYD